ncbi:DUF4231 domain-containing protein [Xylanimonas protaetiae]|uniref:DUF4231 domain-containing protein n=1 Tax=Xylanimonas protaetiae TaxID=2509457 RepID=A0A4P6F4U6_9MICO|nr:DUF4231 domain-containing protein [Xylanimonas protaetiae]QAY69753.1 DUF4231 domain-containing protein [Xylanimonas protaetiae]
MTGARQTGVTEIELPALFQAADRKAAERQRAFYVSKGLEVGALAGGAMAALLPSSLLGGSGPIFALLLFLVALVIQVTKISATAERRWYDARAAAESIRSSAWQYAACGEAFRLENDQADAAFRQVLVRVLDAVPGLDIGPDTDDAPTITTSMRSIRALSLVERSGVYLEQRVAGQVKWYARKAQWNKQRARVYGLVVIGVELAAVVAGILRVATGSSLDFLGAAAAIAAGLVAWTQAKKYTFLSESYAVTSHEVNLVRDTLRPGDDEGLWAQLVHDAEAAFSREHTMWQARRQGAA